MNTLTRKRILLQNLFMRIGRNFLLLLFMFVADYAIGQNITVSRFQILPNDLSARTSPVLDANGIPCSLVKVLIFDELTNVEGNVIKCIRKGSETWLYLTKGTKYIKIFTQHHKPLMVNFVASIGSGLESNTSYLLDLESDLPMSILMGGKDDVAPISISGKHTPILPDWWNMDDRDLYVGISMPTLDGKAAKTAAIINAISLYAQEHSCSIQFYGISEIEYTSDTRENTNNMRHDYVVNNAVSIENFTVDILQEYYNFRGEYFVLCRILSVNKIDNSYRLNTEYSYHNDKVSWTTVIELNLRIGNAILSGSSAFMSDDSDYLYTTINNIVTPNMEELSYPSTQELNANSIVSLKLHEPLGAIQSRLLYGIPILPDSISVSKNFFIEESSIDKWEYHHSMSRYQYIGSEKSSSRNIKLLGINDQKLFFSIEDVIPASVKKRDVINIQEHMDRTSLSIDYLKIEDKSTGMSTPETKQLECKKWLALMNSIVGYVDWWYAEKQAQTQTIVNSTDIATDSSQTGDISTLASIYKCKLPIRPLLYLDANKRIACKSKKNQNDWEKNIKSLNNIVELIMLPLDDF